LECLIGELRIDHGLAPLTVDARLEHAADRHARDMVDRRYFAHRSPEGNTVVDRVRPYVRRASRWVVGENLAWGTGTLSTPAGVLQGFLDSAPHRRVLLDRRSRDIGVGVVPGTPRDAAAAGATYAVVLGRSWR